VVWSPDSRVGDGEGDLIADEFEYSSAGLSHRVGGDPLEPQQHLADIPRRQLVRERCRLNEVHESDTEPWLS